MRWQVYKASIYAAIAVTSVLIAHNAITGAAIPIESSAITPMDLKTNSIEYASTKFIEVSPIESSTPANGDGELNPLVSSVSDLSRVNTMLTKSDWKYVAQIFESEPDALRAGTYMAELFENGKAKGIVFFKQAVANPEMIEGVIAEWDIGNNTPTNAIYTVKVTKYVAVQDGGTT